MKVAVLMGGTSAEREISLRTGRGIAQALRNLGHEVTAIDAADGRLLPAGDEEERAARRSSALEPRRRRRRSRAPRRSREAEVVFDRAPRRQPARTARCRRCSISPGKPYTGSGRARERARDEQGDVASASSSRPGSRRRAGSSRAAAPRPRAHRDAAAHPAAGLPLVVKPNEEGSTRRSHDRAATPSELRRGVRDSPSSYGARDPDRGSSSRAAS